MKKKWITLIILGVVLFFGGQGALNFLEQPWLLDGESIAGLKLVRHDQIQEVNGKLVAGFNERKIRYVPIERIPSVLKDAMIAVEDNRFYQHGGVDLVGLARAVIVNFKSGGFTEGGSTITQQLAKNLYLSPEKTLQRKAVELVLAFQLENRYSKNDILEMYLNQIYFEHNCYGIENASQKFFGKSVRELDLAEAAMLAGIPKNPARYSPLRNLEESKARQKLVLSRMVENRLITEKEAQEAYETKIPVQKGI